MNLEGRNVRVGVHVGVTIPVRDFTMVKPGFVVEIDVLEDEDIDNIIDELTDYAMGKLEEQEEILREYVG